MCNCKPGRKYGKSSRTFNKACQVPISPNCNGWLVQNIGQSYVVVDNAMILQPFQSIALGGNEGETFDDKLYVQFQPNPNIVGPQIDLFSVMQKIYIDGDKR